MNRRNVMRVFRAEVALADIIVTGQWSDKRKSTPQQIKYRLCCFPSAASEIGAKVYARTGANFEVSQAITPLGPEATYISFYK